MNMYIVPLIVVPLIATLLVMTVLIGCTKLLDWAARRIIRMRAMIEASRRCRTVCRPCTAIDYTVELQRLEESLEAWNQAHPFGPRTMAETAELDELYEEMDGTRILMAMELNQTRVVKQIIEGS